MQKFDLVKLIQESRAIDNASHFDSFKNALQSTKQRKAIKKHSKASASDCRQFIIECIHKAEFTQKQIVDMCQDIYKTHKRSTFNTYCADLKNDKYFKNVYSKKALVDKKTKIVHF